MTHIPVLLKETLEHLDVKTGLSFVDATVGGGGHTEEILASNPTAKVLGIDLDQASLDKLRSKLTQEGLGQRTKLVQGNYRDIDRILPAQGWDKVDGILLDLGFSSLQLDDSARGFSFSSDGPLDMRYDSQQRLTAEKVVNQYHPSDLERVISEYGEEKLARRIAKAIVEARKKEIIATTAQLAEVVKSAVPLPIRFKANDNIRRVFQAIRIEVNAELDNLRATLPKILSLLNPNGCMVIISFHSLEDRIVKEFMVAESKDCICPPEFPTCVCGKASTLRILTRKPVTAGEEEIAANPRSKSAKLRAAAKI
jgi:16S rRNA (cytosine1402-N4)-methyltransferase